LHSDSQVQGDIKYGFIAIEHGAKVMGLLLQVSDASNPNMDDFDAQNAIRKAQSVTGSGN
jgi:hypothetical protein